MPSEWPILERLTWLPGGMVLIPSAKTDQPVDRRYCEYLLFCQQAPDGDEEFPNIEVLLDRHQGTTVRVKVVEGDFGKAFGKIKTKATYSLKVR